MTESTARAHEDDAFDLARFLRAQQNVYAAALRELKAGRKESHWIWYVFPQIDGLGKSETAVRYAIKSFDEATAYVAHPVLGVRLLECVECVNGLQGRTALQIFGTPDDLKFCSSLTLFEAAAPEIAAFTIALEKYFGGRRDVATLRLLRDPKR